MEEWEEVLSLVEEWKIISSNNLLEVQDAEVEAKWEEWAGCLFHLWEDSQEEEVEEEVVVEQVEIHSRRSVSECSKLLVLIFYIFIDLLILSNHLFIIYYILILI